MPRLLALAVGLSWFAMGRASADEPPTYPLWPNGAPGATGKDVGDANHAGDIPTITVYLAPKEKATGAAVVICPGGGYGFLATDHEGKQVAEWLNTLGVAGVVLKYRLAPKYRHRLTGATWTGRGKQPKWFAAAEQSELEHLSGDLA